MHRHHLVLLCPLLLVTLASNAQQHRRDTLILHFAFDSYHIRQEDELIIHTTLRETHVDSFFITGYTDKMGTSAYNRRLSEQRANAAAAYLGTTYGTSIIKRISGAGVAPTPDLSDSENRRVEIVLYRTISTRPYDTIARNATSRISPPAASARHADSIVVIKSAPTDTTTADSAQPSAVLALRRINFIVDTPIPTDSTRRILPQFITELRQFKDHRLEIDGYVNSIVPLHGTDDPLFKLSVNRAKFIYDCLVSAGFDPSLLTYKGMGNASPINPHPQTKQEMNANMRVEIRVY